MKTWWRSLWPDERIAAVAWMMAIAWASAALWPLTVLAVFGWLMVIGMRRFAR